MNYERNTQYDIKSEGHLQNKIKLKFSVKIVGMAEIKFPYKNPVIDRTRKFAQDILLHPLFKIEKHGLTNLEIMKTTPVIIPYAIHTGHGDILFVAHAILESGFNQFAIPGAADYWFEDPKMIALANLFAPVFPLPRPSKAEYGSNPLAGFKDAIKLQMYLIKERRLSLLLSAEGTRTNLPPEDRVFMPGSAYLALKAGVPIIPATVVGYETVLPKGTTIPHPFDLNKKGPDKRKVIKVIFGEPLSVTGIKNTSHNQEELTENLKQTIVQTYHQYANKT